jgi:CheY-like chemotaxis protein
MRELKTALVVEDNRISRMMLREILLIHGVEVLEAADGVEAIEIIERGPPDLVISDILMPRCDGFKLAAHIKSAGYSPPMVLFLVTAVYKSQVWKREALTDHHVHEFITKPIDPEDFMGIIRRYFTLPAQPPPYSEPDEDETQPPPFTEPDEDEAPPSPLPDADGDLPPPFPEEDGDLPPPFPGEDGDLPQPFPDPDESTANQSPDNTAGAAAPPAKVHAKAHPNRVSADQNVDDLVSRALRGLVADKKAKK